MTTRLIDVGGYRLNTSITGSGMPPVVLLACAGGGADHWENIIPQLSELTTCVAYGRAGTGDSDALPDAESRPPGGAEPAATELQALLSRAGLEPPYVFLTSSLGAFVAERYAALWPEEVAGEVLLDHTNMTPWAALDERDDVIDEGDGSGYRYNWDALLEEMSRPRLSEPRPTVILSSAPDRWQRWPPAFDGWLLPLDEVDRTWQEHQREWARHLSADRPRLAVGAVGSSGTSRSCRTWWPRCGVGGTAWC